MLGCSSVLGGHEKSRFFLHVSHFGIALLGTGNNLNNQRSEVQHLSFHTKFKQMQQIPNQVSPNRAQFLLLNWGIWRPLFSASQGMNFVFSAASSSVNWRTTKGEGWVQWYTWWKSPKLIFWWFLLVFQGFPDWWKVFVWYTSHTICLKEWESTQCSMKLKCTCKSIFLLGLFNPEPVEVDTQHFVRMQATCRCTKSMLSRNKPSTSGFCFVETGNFVLHVAWPKQTTLFPFGLLKRICHVFFLSFFMTPFSLPQKSLSDPLKLSVIEPRSAARLMICLQARQRHMFFHFSYSCWNECSGSIHPMHRPYVLVLQSASFFVSEWHPPFHDSSLVESHHGCSELITLCKHLSCPEFVFLFFFRRHR